MPKLIFHSLVALLLVVSCECKDMHIRRMPDEKDIVFEGEVKTAKETVYRKGQSRDIQVHLTSSDEEAKDAQFKILSATLADGSPADVDYDTLKLGKNMLHYTPQKPGTHKLTLKVAVEGEEESAQTIHYTLEAPAANWQVSSTADATGNLTIQIADVPEELQGEPWRITNTTWSRGLRGTIADTSTLNCGANNLPVALTTMALEEPPALHMTVENDGEEKSISIDLRTLCIARLQETPSEAQRQTLIDHNEAVEAQAASYQENLTGNNRAEAQRELTRRLEETTRLQIVTNAQLENLETNLNVLRHQAPEGLAELDTRRTELRDVLEDLDTSYRKIQPMVDRLEESNTGRIDPYGVLYEALQQGTYEAASMAPHLESPLLEVNEPDQQGRTLLHLAIEQGNIPLSRALIENRAEVNARDNAGKTPLDYAEENEVAIALLLRAGAVQDLPPDWQLQGDYEAAGQQLVLTIGDTPGRLQQARGEQAQWRITSTTWSEGLEGQIAPNLALQHGENRVPLEINMGILTEAPSVQVVLQGPDRAYQDITLDLREVCMARLRAKETNLAGQTERVNAYVQETDNAYTLPPETVTDPRENRRKQDEIATLLGRLTAFKTQYQADLQAFSGNLTVLEQTQVNENLAVFEANNKRLKDAIASLKSAQVQLQQQCTTAHMALFKTMKNRNQEASIILVNDPKLEVNENNNPRFLCTLLHAATGSQSARVNVEVVSILLEKGAEVNAKNSQGHTALQFAALLIEVEIVRMLLEKGADVNSKDNSRSTALHWAIGTGKPRSVEVVRMLLEKGADVNAKNNVKHTALHDAVRNSNNVAMIRMLLGKGAEVNAKHLDIAREKGHTNVITLLEQTPAR